MINPNLIRQRRQRARDAVNVLHKINDPENRRWRVVAVDGVGPRLNDFECTKTLTNGAVLHVGQWGEMWLDLDDATAPAAEASQTQTIAITVEAEDGAALHTSSDGVVLWRGQGTRLTADWTIKLTGFSRRWAPSAAFSIDAADASTFTFVDVSADELFVKQTTARGYDYVQSIADASGGAVTATLEGAHNASAGSAPPDPTYYKAKRHRDGITFANLVTENVQVSPSNYGVFQWLALSATVSAQTILAVVRRGNTTPDSPLLAGPDGSTHHVRYASGAPFDVGTARVEVFHDGRAAAASTLGDEELHILALRFDAAYGWRYVNAQDSLGTLARAQDIRELHFVAGAMSDADIDCWMGYAAHKHDLAWKLPFDHPYRWGPPGFEMPSIDPTPLPDTITFGALTLAGAGGWPLPYGGAHVLGGADAAKFSVSEGMLVPASALDAGPYAITVDGVAVEVTTQAGVYSVRSQAEQKAAEIAFRSLGADAAIRWREGRFGYLLDQSFRVPENRTLTIDCDVPRRTVFSKFGIKGESSSLCPGAIVLEKIRAHDDNRRDGIIAVTNTGGGSTIRDAEAHGDWIDPQLDFFTYYHDRGSVIACSSINGVATLEQCDLHNFNAGGTVKSSNNDAYLRNNFIHGRFGDGVNITSPDSYGHRRHIYDNLIRDSYGQVSYYSKPHTDVTQLRLVNQVGAISNYPNSIPTLISVQRNIVWQSLDNLAYVGGSNPPEYVPRRGERGFYIEGSSGGYGQFSGVVSANVIFGNHESGIDCNPSNGEAVVARDNTLVAPDGAIRLGGARVQDRNVAHTIAFGSSFRDEILATAIDGSVQLQADETITWPDDIDFIFTDAARVAGMGPHDILAAVAPVASGPLDLGGDVTVGAVTMAGVLKPLVTEFPPERPDPPTLALDGSSNLVVTFPAAPADLSGLPILRWDVRLAPTNDCSNGTEPDWTLYENRTSGFARPSTSPGDPNYARVRIVTAAGPGPWSIPSNGVTPLAVTGTGWTPGSAKRVVHYDAQSPDSIIKTGSTVTAVADLAGNADLLVLGAPQHGVRLLGGQPVFDCPNTSSFLASGVAIPRNHTFAMVFNVDANNNEWDAVFHVGEESRRYELRAGGSAAFFGKTRLVGLAVADPSGGVFGSNFWINAPYVIFVAQFNRDASTVSYYLNGTLLKTVEHPLNAVDPEDDTILLDVQPENLIGLWRNGSGTRRPTGAWAEAVMLDGVKMADRRRLEGYMAHRWGVTGLLPADHPYKIGAP